MIHQQMQQLATVELAELSRDLLTWRTTGVLPAGRFQALAALAEPIAPNDAFQQAEAVVIAAALEFAGSNAGGAALSPPQEVQVSPSSWPENLRGWLSRHHPEVQDWPEVIIAKDVDLVRDCSDTARSIEEHVIEGHPFSAEELQSFLLRVTAPAGHVLVVLTDPKNEDGTTAAKHFVVVLPSGLIP